VGGVILISPKNIEGQAQPPRHRPYDKHLRKQVVHLYFVSGVKCSAIARWFSGRPCRKTVQRIIQDYRVHRAVRVPQEGLSPLPESMMQWLPSCWCLLCRVTCMFDTCLHCTSLAMLARTSMAGVTRTPSVLSSCVLAAAPLRLRGRGVSASDGSGPSCLSCSVSSGLSPAPLVHCRL